MDLLNADHNTSAKLPLLKSADQYLAWRTRVADKCWALTGHDLADVTDKECVAALKTAGDEKEAAKRDCWVSKCWLIITSSLHDDLLLKLTVKRGLIQSLMAEINAALQINSAEEIQPLRLELYGATMQKDGNADLQTYIAYLMQRQKKLAAHGKPVEDEEMISIFLKGLHPVYQPLQVHFAIPGTLPKRFDQVVDIVRRYSATPAAAVELAKLKSGGVSQNMFNMTPQQTAKKPLCRMFASKGACRFGTNCKFLHTTTPRESDGPAAQDGVHSATTKVMSPLSVASASVNLQHFHPLFLLFWHRASLTK